LLLAALLSRRGVLVRATSEKTQDPTFAYLDLLYILVVRTGACECPCEACVLVLRLIRLHLAPTFCTIYFPSLTQANCIVESTLLYTVKDLSAPLSHPIVACCYRMP